MSPSNEASRPGPVEVARASDLFQAKILASYLEGFDIPAHVPDEAMMGAMDGAAVIWAKGVRVEVPAQRAEEAKRLLAEREERRKVVPDEDDDDDA